MRKLLPPWARALRSRRMPDSNICSNPSLLPAAFPCTVWTQAQPVGVSHRFGVRLDLGYVRASNVLSSGHHSDILSYLGGPVYYPFTTSRMETYVHFLAGGARVTGVVPSNQGQLITGYANEFAWAGGGGFQIDISSATAVRVGGDYLHTSYFDPSGALHGQGNLRAVVSFVYVLGRSSRGGS